MEMSDPLALSTEPMQTPTIQQPASAGLDIVGRAKAALTAAPPAGSPRDSTAGTIIRGAGDVMLPGSVPEAAFMIGTLGTGAIIRAAAKLVPLVAKLPMSLARIVIGSVSEGTATAVEGEGFTSGAVKGAIAGTVGETIGAVGGAALKRIPGVKYLTEGGERRAAEATKNAQIQFKQDVKKYGEDVASIKSKYQSDVEQRRETVSGLKDSYQTAKSARSEQIKAQDDAYKQSWAEYRQAIDHYGQTVQGAESTAMASQVGGLIERRVPTLGNRRTAEQLDALKQKGTKALVGEYFNNKVSEAATLTGGPGTTFRIPSLRRVPEASKINAGDAEAMDMLKETLIGPGGQKIHISELRPDRISGVGAADIIKAQESAASAQEGRMTLSTIVDKLAALRLSAQVSNDPAVRTVAGKASRMKMQTALSEIEGELSSHNPAAWDAFHEGRKAYAYGSAVIDLFRRDGLFKRSADKVDLNPRALQSMVAKHRGWLEERMGTEDFRDFSRTIQRGGELGPADVLAKKGQLPQFVGRPEVSVPPMPSRQAMPPTIAKPTLPLRVTRPALPAKPVYQAPTSPTMTYPVDLTRAFIDSAVHRALP